MATLLSLAQERSSVTADYLNHKRDEYERRRGDLQQVGTRSAHLTIKSIGSRFARWSADYLHRVSKAVVREAVKNDCTAIAFENLKHIRERISNGSKFQQWAFKELQRHVEYKAEEYGIDVDDVAPSYTSQQCSHSECGFTHEENRDGDEFECLNAGTSCIAITTPLEMSDGVLFSTGSSLVLNEPRVNWL